MADAKTPTMQDLLTQRAALDKQLAALEVQPLEKTLAMLQQPEIKAMADDLKTLFDQTPDGETKTQINNIFIVLTAGAVALQNRRQVLDQLLA